MSSKSSDWRITLLRDAQRRFERDVIRPVQTQLREVRARLKRELAGLRGPDKDIRARALEREIKRVDRVNKRVTRTKERARSHFNKQVAARPRKRATKA